MYGLLNMVCFFCEIEYEGVVVKIIYVNNNLMLVFTIEIKASNFHAHEKYGPSLSICMSLSVCLSLPLSSNSVLYFIYILVCYMAIYNVFNEETSPKKNDFIFIIHAIE